MDLAERAERDKNFMFDCLDNIDIENIRSEGLRVRVGEKILRLEMVSETDIPELEEIKQEFKERINLQQARIKQKINSKIEEITEYYHKMRLEYKRKEKELKDILSKSAPMPDIFKSHARQGLSLVKGDGKNQLIWLVQGVYWPKTYDNEKIEPKFSKKMISPVVYMIKTNDNKVTNVSTRKPIGLDYFMHYHQSRPDCWGSWKNPTRWSKPEDIINIARQAEAVLENIHPGSIAEPNPRGLPRQNTIKRHLLPIKSDQKMGTLNQSTRRAGITESMRSEDNEVWSL